MRVRALVGALVLLAATSFTAVPSAIAATRAGDGCSSAGLRTSELLCARVNGRLIWKQLKTQRITAVTPDRVPLRAEKFPIFPVASSLLTVGITSSTPEVCDVIDQQVQLRAVGACLLTFTQRGNKVYSAATLQKRIPILGENTLVVPAIPATPLTTGFVQIGISSSSGLPIVGTSKSESTCFVDLSGQVRLLAAGMCTVVWTQPGNEFYPPATPIESSFAVLAQNLITFDAPAELSISSSRFTLAAKATSGQPVTITSTTPSICRVEGADLLLLQAGSCSVSATQAAVGYFTAASPVTRTIRVVAGRTTSDQPDIRSGFQLQFIYVVPSDGTDNRYDVDGSIKQWIDEGQSYMRSQLGFIFPIDTTSTGYDIRYIKSRYTTAQLSAESQYSCTGPSALLANEAGVPCLASRGYDPSSGKYYIFMIDTQRVATNYCGYAGRPGNLAVMAIAPGAGCTGTSGGLSSWRIVTWIHEVLHGLGVEHVPTGSCDLMQASGSCSQLYLDRDRKFYVGTSAYGVDLLGYGFWIRQ